jgi:hypothetical protein
MMFCQLAQAKSLREITDGLACCEGKLNHLGLPAGPKRSTLSFANARRPWQLFEQVFYDQLGLAQSLAPSQSSISCLQSEEPEPISKGIPRLKFTVMMRNA